ncbi:biotin transporter BioY [Brucella pseudogrignonensis]|uniref:biotin transporter BioY n=1 Tax=Brucella pseudogrignonensis TaxID=419475 RepID=UPI000DE38C90|nr:biotin transporter BioY [Brucella pseudogrignonensis]KAB2688600.1 biotin transporter BioY [Brucella pseudogrignonensis]MCD4512601.1 biotin transporter BioY [Brucella pseudogrignonensis]
MQTRSLVMIALFTAIIVVLGLIPPIMLTFVPVPIHAQSLGVLLAGVVLGARGGALSALLLIALVAIGLPVLSGGRGGLGIFFSPTAGYLVGFLPAAFVTGWISNKVAQSTIGGWKTFAGFFIAVTVGVIIDHIFGVAWLVAYVGLSPWSAIIGDLAFVPGDLLKAAIAAYAGQFIFVNFGNRTRDI